MFIYKSKGIFISTSNNCSTYKCANIKPNTVINRTECCNDNQGDGFFSYYLSGLTNQIALMMKLA